MTTPAIDEGPPYRVESFGRFWRVVGPGGHDRVIGGGPAASFAAHDLNAAYAAGAASRGTGEATRLIASVAPENGELYQAAIELRTHPALCSWPGGGTAETNLLRQKAPSLWARLGFCGGTWTRWICRKT